jgi:hypothetical protein
VCSLFGGVTLSLIFQRLLGVSMCSSSKGALMSGI